MRVTAPADRRFRRAHVRPGRKRTGLARWRWRALAAVVVLALGGFAAHRGFNRIAGMRMLRVQRIVVHGNNRLSNGEMLALLDGLRGQSILTINLDEWRTTLMNSPWVADALLRRTLPSTVDVSVQERHPLGIGRINGSLYLIDDNGMVIDEYGPHYADLDLPIIDGLSSVPGEASSDLAKAMLARRLIDALRVRNMAARVSQIDVSDARNAVVLLDGDPTQVRLGDEHFVERLQSYVDLAPALRERVLGIDYVDMRFDERIYVRPTAHGEAAPPLKASGARAKGQGEKS
jgi:cell division protein FtsQ